MKVLVCHNYYTSKSGEDIVIANDLEILRKAGISIVEYSRYNAELQEKSIVRRLGAMVGLVYSFKTTREIKKLVQREKPDLAIIQNVFPLISPSIYYCLKRRGVPVLQLVYNYRFICPNAILYTRGQICERCVPGNYLHAIRWRCFRNSFFFSAAYALTLHLHRRIGQVTNKIDGYVTPDLFLQKKLAEGGISNTQFFKIMNPFDIAKYTPLYCPGKYFVFFGRIVREKGVFTLLAAMEKVPDLTLRVIGFGPSEGDAREMVRTRKIRNVEFCGPKYDSDLIEDLNHAIAVIVPTEWYDNSPLVIHQAFALGIPVIASDIDGIPEIVEDGQNGLLFKPGDAQQLADRMRYLVGDPDLRNRLGRNARKKAELEFTAEVRTKGMLAAMQAVIKGGRSD